MLISQDSLEACCCRIEGEHACAVWKSREWSCCLHYMRATLHFPSLSFDFIVHNNNFLRRSTTVQGSVQQVCSRSQTGCLASAAGAEWSSTHLSVAVTTKSVAVNAASQTHSQHTHSHTHTHTERTACHKFATPRQMQFAPHSACSCS